MLSSLRYIQYCVWPRWRPGLPTRGPVEPAGPVNKVRRQDNRDRRPAGLEAQGLDQLLRPMMRSWCAWVDIRVPFFLCILARRSGFIRDHQHSTKARRSSSFFCFNEYPPCRIPSPGSPHSCICFYLVFMTQAHCLARTAPGLRWIMAVYTKAGYRGETCLMRGQLGLRE